MASEKPGELALPGLNNRDVKAATTRRIRSSLLPFQP
jgi:hypothetical protein